MGIDLKMQNPFCDDMTIEGEYLGNDICKYLIGGGNLNKDIVMYCSRRFIRNHLQYPPIDTITDKEKDVMLHSLSMSSAPVLFCEDKFEALRLGRGRFCCIPYRQLEEIYTERFPD